MKTLSIKSIIGIIVSLMVFTAAIGTIRVSPIPGANTLLAVVAATVSLLIWCYNAEQRK